MNSNKPTKLTLDLIRVDLPPKKPIQINLKIDPELKQAFQIWCVQHQTTMSLQLETMIKQCIESDR